ncbi:ABC transporter ATP-binding protein [Roseateles asaccharophilus]|uniref:ABC-type sugar transport system ATPase subunit n=1 Tax=Roseateles asaccharophilus TaxID=582607 RepID=A0ABU2AEW5_9BURK|nr:ABC transporter ATP-binding protein [Roseateles asaccharophilus]MDR7334533.1 ABC-type sugar transport system ATPase subunit [Roseateles asaccharophilus]
MTTPTLQLRGLRKQFGNTTILHGIDLTLNEGEFLVFVGPSGCGKSTLLRLIAGLESASGGQFLIDGKDCTQAPPSERGLAMVFQSYALYPHMTVEQNLTFGMRMRGVPKADIARKLDRAVTVLKLQPYLQRRPGELSGGQCQRVAIGRALVQQPRVFLFDEPLSNLDAELRLHMRVELAALHRELGSSMIYVTHDQVEAMTLADRIVVLRDGRVEQAGPPLQLYREPANAFVAGFIGSPAINLFDAAALPALAPTGAARLGVRPEHWRCVDASTPGAVGAKAVHVERLGAISYLYAQTEHLGRVCVQLDGGRAAEAGDTLALQPHPDWIYAFDAQGARLAA